jgi:hypothetical protein
MKRWAAVAPLLIVASTGCLASKGDIRLLQEELRANRAQLGAVDTSIVRASEQRQRQIAALSATIDRMNDSLRTLAARFSAFQATANGEFDAMGRQMVAMQSLLGQTTRNVQDTRAQLEALREQGNNAMTATPTEPRATPSSSCSAPGPIPRKRPGRSSSSRSRTRVTGTCRPPTRYIRSFMPSIPRAPKRRRRCTSTGCSSGMRTRRPTLASSSIACSASIPIPTNHAWRGIS